MVLLLLPGCSRVPPGRARNTLLPLLRLAMLLTFALPSTRRALVRRPQWRSVHHMVQRLLPLAAALHGVLGMEVTSSSLQHALPCWLEWCLPVFLGWMSFMLVVSPACAVGPGAPRTHVRAHSARHRSHVVVMCMDMWPGHVLMCGPAQHAIWHVLCCVCMVFDMPVLAAYCGPMLPASAPAQLPTRLQLVTGLLEWLLYSATALAAAVRMQGAGMSDLHLRALVAWPFMVMFALPTWGVALHGRGLQKQYRLLQQQRITAKAADSGATGEACTGSSSSCGLGSKQRTDSILSRFKAEALHRSASAPGRLGTGACTEDQPAHDKTPDSVAPRDVGLPAAQVPHMAAGPSSSAEAAPAAAVDQSLQLVMAAPPLVVLDGASSSQGQELAAAASMWAPPFPAPSTAAGSNSSGDSSNDHVQQEQGSMSRVSVGSAPPATTATAAVAAVPPLMLDALGAAEEAPDDDVDIAAIRDSLQPRLAALLGPELGEQLLSNLGVERPAGVPHYTSKVEVIPVSCKVSETIQCGAHKALHGSHPTCPAFCTPRHVDMEHGNRTHCVCSHQCAVLAFPEP